jgi:NADH:ubiquinone oxidoreductase subunit K/NADH:ubiquinone oxidoreductase subunit 6 (subunit J)
MIGFVLLAVALVASAIFVVTASKPVYSVVGLLVNFIALAITYLTLHAEFLAVIQIVVYSGAILILFVFVIALLSSGVKPFAAGPDKAPRILIPALVCAAIGAMAVTGAALETAFAPEAIYGLTGQADVFGSVSDFGNALFRHNLLPFEITAFVLMVAIVGVVLLAGDDGPSPSRRTKRTREPVDAYIALSSIMFFTGIVGVIARRNPLIQLMSIELLFNSANLALVTFARTWGNNTGHIFAFLVITVAAAEAAIGLAIVVIVFRRTTFVDVDEVSTLKG